MVRRAISTPSPLRTGLSGKDVSYRLTLEMLTNFLPLPVRLFPNGRVLYSQRLTIRAHCIMNLQDFPMDRQRCPLKIGSCRLVLTQYWPSLSVTVGYTSSDLTYQWTAGRGVNIASDMKLSQFDLISTPTGNQTVRLNHGEWLGPRSAWQSFTDCQGLGKVWFCLHSMIRNV